MAETFFLPGRHHCRRERRLDLQLQLPTHLGKEFVAIDFLQLIPLFIGCFCDLDGNRVRWDIFEPALRASQNFCTLASRKIV